MPVLAFAARTTFETFLRQSRARSRHCHRSGQKEGYLDPEHLDQYPEGPDDDPAVEASNIPEVPPSGSDDAAWTWS